MAFPTLAEFTARIDQEMGRGILNPPPPAALGQKLSEEFKSLIVNYCAGYLEALDLSQIRWGVLAARLGTKQEFLKEAAENLNQEGGLWQEVLYERIRRANADRVFSDIGWKKLESGAVAKLLFMLDRNLIRDTGELIALATSARRTNGTPQSPPPAPGGNNMQVNFNIGGEGTPQGDLPAAGHRMSIDLSPRAAKALGQRAQVMSGEHGSRVIDGEMLSAEELRSLLQERATEPLPVEHEPAQNEA